jgi:uncharacterized protein (DUF2236 family)
MAGPELLYGEPDSSTPDPGLFGPGSMTWRVHGDPSGLVGGVRALLLQALHPEAMAGVAAHSDFREDPWGRLTRTAEYIAVTSFGTSAEAEAAAARVRMVHRRLGVDRPDLLLWVHAGFVDSLLGSYTRSVGLSPGQADAYVLEQQEAARLIGLDPAEVFGSVADLQDYLRGTRPVLQITPAAMEAARFVVVPPMDARVRWLTPAQGLWATLAATAFASLPTWARRMYGQGTGPLASVVSPALGGVPVLSDLQATLAVKVWRRTLLALPESVRKGPHIRAAEARLGLTGA